MRSFLKSVANEYKRVTWPSKLELRAATIVVLFTLVLFATYLGFFNFLFDAVFTAIGY
ncbi:MAG: preprotein translocase subunit SecE [Armatimonadetes bacterium]|nr:preprotein translocase subunit SecE [Armatimonadota bacterium]